MYKVACQRFCPFFCVYFWTSQREWRISEATRQDPEPSFPTKSSIFVVRLIFSSADSWNVVSNVRWRQWGLRNCLCRRRLCQLGIWFDWEGPFKIWPVDIWQCHQSGSWNFLEAFTETSSNISHSTIPLRNLVEISRGGHPNHSRLPIIGEWPARLLPERKPRNPIRSADCEEICMWPNNGGKIRHIPHFRVARGSRSSTYI